MKKIIGLAGKAGSGKNSFSGFLITELSNSGYVVLIDSYSYDIKKLMREEFNWKGQKTDFFREAMITHGEFKREKQPDYWVRKTEERINKYKETAVDYIVLPDVRNEYDARFVRENGILIIMQGRKQEDMKKELADNITEQLNFPSYDKDVVISNNGGLEDLKNGAKLFIGNYLGE